MRFRPLRWIVRLLAALLVLLAIGALVLQTPWAHERARRLIESRVTRLLNGELRVGALTGSFWGGVTLANVSIVQAGTPVIAVASIDVRYRPWQVFRAGVVDDVILTGLRADIVEHADGWNIAGLAAPRPPSTGPGPSISIDRLQVVASEVDIRPRDATPRRIVELNLQGALKIQSRTTQITIEETTARDASTGLPIRELAGVLRFQGRTMAVDALRLATARSRLTGQVSMTTLPTGREVDIAIEAAPISMPELAAYFPQLTGVTVAPTASISLRGPLARLQTAVVAQDPAGRINASGQTGFAEGVQFKGAVELAGTNLAAWLGRPGLAGRVTGRADVDLSWVSGTANGFDVKFAARAPEVAVGNYRAAAVDVRGTYRGGVVAADGSGVAYGARARGHFRWSPRTFASRGHVAGLDLRGLPAHLDVPRFATDIDADYDVTFDGSNNWSAAGTFAPSVIEGARFAAGTTAQVARNRGVLSYRANGVVTRLDLDRARAMVAEIRRANPEVPDPLARFTGVVNATFAVEGRGTTLAEVSAGTTLHLTDSVIAGIDIVTMDAKATIDRRRLIADIDADLRRISNAAIGTETKFAADGRAVVHADIPEIGTEGWIERASGSVTATFTGASAFDTTVDRIVAEATVVPGLATVKSLEITAPDLKITSSGTLALNDNHSSDLVYDITASDLAKIPRAASAKLAGSAHAEGRVTGPFSRLSTAGKLQTHGVAAGSNRALTLNGAFDATLVDRDFAKVAGLFDGQATFVEAGGYKIDIVTAKIKYDAGTVDVDATLDQRTRTLRFAGSMIPHPDHREVHIRSLAAVAGEETWNQQEGQEALVQYGADRLVIRGFDLVRNESRIRVAGTLGTGDVATAEPLTIVAERVRVEDINKILLGTHTLEGQLDATVRLEGTMAAPRVTGSGSVVAGAVDGTRFDRLDASGSFENELLTLDVNLQAGEFGQLTAAGTMPVRFGASAPESTPPFNLRVQSDRLNLGLLQPLVADLEQLKGTATVRMLITGSARSPQLGGDLGIADAGFHVAPTGVTYTNVKASMIFEGERVNIKEFQLADDDNHVATITGAVDVSVAGPPTAFDLYVTSDDFHVLKNSFGEVSLKTDLHALGNLKAPLLVGTIEVERGRLEVDDILDRLAAGGYTAAPAEAQAAAAGAKPAEPSAFSQSSFSITLALPDNVIVRGRDLRASAGSFGLGDINATLGGALSLSKETGEAPTIKGRLDIVRGQYTFQGRRFTIARGSEVVFSGESFLDPALNVTAERQIGAVAARVRVGGSARRPELTLSSTPPLDQGDILSLIVFNQTMNELGTTERVSLAGRAGTLAARALAAPLADSVMRALDFDLFEITPNDDVGTGASLVVGRQVSERLFVGFQQNFGADDVSQVSFEYRLTEFLRLITTFAQGADRSRSVPRAETAGLDLFFVIRR